MYGLGGSSSLGRNRNIHVFVGAFRWNRSHSNFIVRRYIHLHHHVRSCRMYDYKNVQHHTTACNHRNTIADKHYM